MFSGLKEERWHATECGVCLCAHKIDPNITNTKVSVHLPAVEMVTPVRSVKGHKRVNWTRKYDNPSPAINPFSASTSSSWSLKQGLILLGAISCSCFIPIHRVICDIPIQETGARRKHLPVYHSSFSLCLQPIHLLIYSALLLHLRGQDEVL